MVTVALGLNLSNFHRAPCRESDKNGSNDSGWVVAAVANVDLTSMGPGPSEMVVSSPSQANKHESKTLQL